MAVPSNSYTYLDRRITIKYTGRFNANAKNILPQFRDVSWDPGRQYSAPWQWGSTGVSVNTKYYKGDINTSVFFLILQMNL